jgi:hypothetical protein
MSQFDAELLAIERTLGARPLDLATLRAAVAAYARARRTDATPEALVRDLKRSFESLIRDGEAEAFAIRTDAVTLAISIFYRGTR